MLSEQFEKKWKEEPPVNLHFQAIIGGRLVEPWNVPIIVDNEDNQEPVERIKVSRQGEDGTTPKPSRRTGEVGYIGIPDETVYIAGVGEPLAADPISHALRHDTQV